MDLNVLSLGTKFYGIRRSTEAPKGERKPIVPPSYYAYEAEWTKSYEAVVAHISLFELKIL